MDREPALEHLRRDGDAMAAAVTADPQAAVPACPAWTVADLTGHTGGIHRWSAAMVRNHAAERLSRRDLPRPPEDPAALVEWFRDGLSELVEVLATADLTVPMWTFGADRTASFWVRRMTQETAVHRWDAEAATTVPRPLDPELAADGIDEFLHVFVPMAPNPDQRQGGLELRSSIDDRVWRFPFGEAGAEAVATGTPSDLLLFLWGRVAPDRLQATGATELLDRWQEDVRL